MVDTMSDLRDGVPVDDAAVEQAFETYGQFTGEGEQAAEKR